MDLPEAMRTQNACRPFPRKLHRPEVADLAFTDTFGVPLADPGP